MQAISRIFSPESRRDTHRPPARRPRPHTLTTTEPAEAYPPPVLSPLHEPLLDRPPTAPTGFGGSEDPRNLQSWYHPRRGTSRGPAPPPGTFGPAGQASVAADGGRTYVPMPPGPTVVQPPWFDTLMAILQEHRLAQLATVDQQREFLRYMHGLNQWLERDAQDRQAELRDVSARVDQLRDDLGRLGMGMGPGIFPNVGGVQPPPTLVPAPFIVPPVPEATVLGPIGQPPIVGGVYPPPPRGFVPQSGPRPVPPPGQPIIFNAPPTNIVVEPSRRSRIDSVTSDRQHSYHPPPHSAEVPPIPVTVSQGGYDIPAVVPVVNSGSRSHGSPSHQTIVINQSPQPGSPGPIITGPSILQSPVGIPGQPGYPQPGGDRQWQGPPIITQPQPLTSPIVVGTRSSSRGSSRTHHDEPIVVGRPVLPPAGPTQIFINPTDTERHSEHAPPNVIIRSPTHGSDYGDPGIHRHPSSRGFRVPAVAPVVVQSTTRAIPGDVFITATDHNHRTMVVGATADHILAKEIQEDTGIDVIRTRTRLRTTGTEDTVVVHIPPKTIGDIVGTDATTRPRRIGDVVGDDDDRAPTHLKRTQDIGDFIVVAQSRLKIQGMGDIDVLLKLRVIALFIAAQFLLKANMTVAGIQLHLIQPVRAVEGEKPRGEPSIRHHVPSGPDDATCSDIMRARNERLDDAERQLEHVAHDAVENENRRDEHFLHNEEEGSLLSWTMKLDVTRRPGSVVTRSSWNQKTRVAGAPLPVPPHGPACDAASTIESMHTAAQDAASRHADNMMETITLEREQLAREREAMDAERERERAEMEALHASHDAEREARIHALEEELAAVRSELAENKKQPRLTEEAEMRERERQEAQENDDAIRN
ncbi:hypothetical protein BV22DRAFT_1119610 [Leucogyrophana mollusca]|uniref:Uncharacterized protein n=1 Tax=Leucogyrophana mollusca TaxID=85980 RepID=A0ACB8BIQ6_9AGAM|nr:hypothetical protein BV22DRAFT_1119610 [Leucogyrophana mollusca]